MVPKPTRFRHTLLIFLLLLLLTALPLSASAENSKTDSEPLAEVYSTEPGGSFETAITLSVNSPITVTISTANEKQYLKFQPTATGFYTIESFNNSGDPNILFYNSDYTQIGYSYDDGDNYNFHFTYHLIQGVTYYFKTGCAGSTTGT